MSLFKKVFSLPVYWQILIALFLGVIFGSIFAVNPASVKIFYSEGGVKKSEVITDWNSVKLINAVNNVLIKKFTSAEKNQLISYFKKGSEKSISAEFEFNGYKKIFNDMNSVVKDGTIATDIKFIGNIFIRLLSFIAIPLVLASLIVGAGSLGEVKKLGKIGGITFSLYLITTAVAITIGLIMVNLIRPGERLNTESKERLLATYASETQEKISMGEIKFDIINFVENIIPTNPFRAIANGEMLQIVFFAVMIGLVINFLGKNITDPVINFFSGFSEIMIRMVHIVMYIAPFGVFALISSTVAEFGTNILSTLFWYVITVLAGLIIHISVTYPLIIRFLGKMNPLRFFAEMRNALVIAFTTSSSAATLPVTFDCVENKLGVPNKIAGFVLPLGATINMDGTALYQGVAAVFIAQVYGINLDLTAQLTIIFTAVMASIGTAPVPGVGLIMLIIILNAVNVPPEGIALILGVDRFLDMCRTVPNITGDASVSVAVWKLSGEKS